MSSFQLQRLGMLMEPEPGNLNEVEGVLNPAAARRPDGKLYLFPRLVAKTFYFCSDHCRQKFLSTPAGAKPEGKSGCCCG